MGSVDRPAPSTHPFNSTLETGIRALVVLEAFHPRRCDLLEMTWLDHLVVHTGDLDDPDAPSSLHPDLPNRAAELVVTQIGKECHTACEIRRLTGRCAMPTEGIFCVVTRGGTVRAGDSLEVVAR